LTFSVDHSTVFSLNYCFRQAEGADVKVIILVAVAALACTQALAQAVPVNPPSAEKLELAKTLFEANGGREQAEQAVKAMYAGMGGAFSNLPPAQQKMAGLMIHDMQEEVIALIPQIIDVSVRDYADNLSEKELRDYIAWEQSPSGQSIRNKRAAIAQEMMAQLAPLMSTMYPKLLKKVVDRACVEAHCSAQDRQVIVAAITKSIQPAHPAPL